LILQLTLPLTLQLSKGVGREVPVGACVTSAGIGTMARTPDCSISIPTTIRRT